MQAQSDAAATSLAETPGAAAAAEKLNVAYHAIIGLAIGVVSIFTGLAWPFAIALGIVIGRSGSDRRLGRRQRASAVQVLAVTGGVLGMLFFGAFIGGLISFLVAALAAFSERLAENTRPVDRTMARIMISLIGAIVWFLAVSLLRLNINLSFRG